MRRLSYLFSHASEPLLKVDIPSRQFFHLLQHRAEPGGELLHKLIMILITFSIHDGDICGREKGEKDADGEDEAAL